MNELGGLLLTLRFQTFQQAEQCSAVPAVLFWDQTAVLEVVVVAFTSIYIWLYWRIVRFRAPKSLALRRGLMRKSDIVVEVSDSPGAASTDIGEGVS